MDLKELTNRVEELIREVETTHRYSMSRIYSLYNEVFDRNEKPQSCASCLIRKVRELKTWLTATQLQLRNDDEAQDKPLEAEAKSKRKTTAKKKSKDAPQKD